MSCPAHVNLSGDMRSMHPPASPLVLIAHPQSVPMATYIVNHGYREVFQHVGHSSVGTGALLSVGTTHAPQAPSETHPPRSVAK